MSDAHTKGYTALSALALLALWALFSALLDSPLILPSPCAVARDVASLAVMVSFWQAALATVARVLAGFCLSLAFGCALGFLCAHFSPLRAFCALPVALIRCVPVVSFVLLALFWLDSDALPVLIAVLMGLPLFFTSALSGFSKEDEAMNRVCCVFCLTRAQRFCFLRLPAAAPSIKDAAKNACGLIWKATAAAEVLCVPRFALGGELSRAQVVLETQRVFALTVYIVVFGFLCECLLDVASHLVKRLYRVAVRAYFAADRKAARTQEAHSEEDYALAIHDLSFAYDPSCPVLEHYSECFDAHRATAIIAPSGSGKTTLLNWVANNCPSVSYATQAPALFCALTVLENVGLPLENVLGREDSLCAAKEVLKAFGLEAKEDAFPSELSGGERQRVSLARALVFPSCLLLLDEPFLSLDVEMKRRCAAFLLKQQREHPRTVLFATHDMTEATRLSDVIIVHSRCPMKQKAHFAVTERDRKDSTRLEEAILRALLS